MSLIPALSLLAAAQPYLPSPATLSVVAAHPEVTEAWLFFENDSVVGDVTAAYFQSLADATSNVIIHRVDHAEANADAARLKIRDNGWWALPSLQAQRRVGGDLRTACPVLSTLDMEVQRAFGGGPRLDIRLAGPTTVLESLARHAGLSVTAEAADLSIIHAADLATLPPEQPALVLITPGDRIPRELAAVGVLVDGSPATGEDGGSLSISHFDQQLLPGLNAAMEMARAMPLLGLRPIIRSDSAWRQGARADVTVAVASLTPRRVFVGADGWLLDPTMSRAGNYAAAAAILEWLVAELPNAQPSADEAGRTDCLQISPPVKRPAEPLFHEAHPSSVRWQGPSGSAAVTRVSDRAGTYVQLEVEIDGTTVVGRGSAEAERLLNHWAEPVSERTISPPPGSMILGQLLVTGDETHQLAIAPALFGSGRYLASHGGDTHVLHPDMVRPLVRGSHLFETALHPEADQVLVKQGSPAASANLLNLRARVPLVVPPRQTERVIKFAVEDSSNQRWQVRVRTDGQRFFAFSEWHRGWVELADETAKALADETSSR